MIAAEKIHPIDYKLHNRYTIATRLTIHSLLNFNTKLSMYFLVPVAENK